MYPAAVSMLLLLLIDSFGWSTEAIPAVAAGEYILM